MVVSYRRCGEKSLFSTQKKIAAAASRSVAILSDGEKREDKTTTVHGGPGKVRWNSGLPGCVLGNMLLKPA